ncbi:hypothetical protein EOD41_09345 [Mucilaginibacter limnophilus]|uniref:Uncharacterized protein n=1 Tax=Mucilaginibacter limnophilus TaxID=1932778 RepID=A0A437MT68_9SPHI|nr:hypothetical protein [Mucilaginibacter limnophilus]RVU00832.1 hypothetical protein EOD41_09345 [Mucilaginibacter limnophilus]
MPKLKFIVKTFLLKLPLQLLFFSSVSAQQFGGNPPSVKWGQVVTPSARVIFPMGMDSLARHIASVIDQADSKVVPTIGKRQKQVSIVLQNQTTEANGYVGLAPFRSEFYLTPQQNSFELGSAPWAELLSIHEYRHVQQYNNMNVGLSHILRIVFGEGGQTIGNALSVPDWFFEGDAVYNETLLSKQGRGRLPYFFKDYRALWAAGKNYSWMKLRNGSYVDYVPNHYPLGYMLVAYGREKYGANIWRDIVHSAASFNGLFYPLQKAVKKHTGEDYSTFRANAFYHFKDQFDDAAPAGINLKSHFIANQEFPVWADDTTLIYLRTEWKHLPVFVKRTGSLEKKISVRGVTTDNYLDYNNGKIVYTSYRPDLRWSIRNYSEIRIVNVKTGEDKALTNRSKYFSPSFSSDGKQIVAVDVSSSVRSALHILDAEKGCLLTAVNNQANLFYTYPKFYADGSVITAVRDSLGKMSIALVNATSGKHTYLLPFNENPIGFLSLKGDTVYFTATSKKNDALYALNISDKKLYKLEGDLLKNSIGNYQPTVSANKIAFTGFTAYGYQISQVNKSEISWNEVSGFGELSNFNIASLNKNKASGLLATVKDSSYKTQSYSKWHNLFNFHSLIPEISDPDYKFSLVGENVLNTFQSELFFNYNRNEGYKQVGFEATYGALFPYISAGADYVYERRRFYQGGQLYWNEMNFHGGLQVPLNFSRGRQLTGLNIGTDIYFSRTDYPAGFNAFNRSFTYLNSYFTFSTRIQQARQHIYPHFGQSFTFINKHALNATGNQFMAAGTFYFPGLSANHNLIITASHQQHGSNDDVAFSNNFAFSRGYTAENLYRMNKVGANYHFPIAYPDAGVANTIYLLRIRGNLFYEYTHGTDFFRGNKFKADFRSVGATLFFDTKFFNQQSLTFGVRYSRLLDDNIFGQGGRNQIEIVLPVSYF